MLKGAIAAAMILIACEAQAQTPKAFEAPPGCKKSGEDMLKICGQVHRGMDAAQIECFRQHSQASACSTMSKGELQRRKALARKEGQDSRASGKLPN